MIINIPENFGFFHFVGIGGIGMSGIAEILIKSGFAAPKLIDEKIKKNYVIVEDLGLKSFKTLLSGKKKMKNYKKIIDLLIKIQNKNMLKKAQIPSYSKNFLNNEIQKNPYVVRVVGSNIKLDRFYENIDAKIVINKLIKFSSPTQSEKIFFFMA